MDNSKQNSLLIVDDDKSNLMALSSILEDEYNVRVAGDGKTALSIAEKHLPDLILLDILMPDMDGYQIYSELQNIDTTAHIPVIFISGLNNNEDIKKGLILGAVEYITKPFDDTIVNLRVRHQIQIINQLRTIEHLSMIDQLTAIPNRRNFDNRLKMEWGRAIRENSDICLLLIDVDHFKRYNDKYGHQQGDKVLCMVAETITKTLRRASDFVARWGGEEFVVLLPNSDTTGGMEIAEHIRKNILAGELLLNNGESTKITVSIGVNSVKPTLTTTFDDFLLKADRALYSAKNAGRNRVRIYDE